MIPYVSCTSVRAVFLLWRRNFSHHIAGAVEPLAQGAFLKLTDFLAPYLLLGYAFGRVGCYLNGCCYGKATAFFEGFPLTENLLRHPVQLYASAGA